MRPFRVSSGDVRYYFAAFAFCVAPGHIAGNVIFLIYDECLSIVVSQKLVNENQLTLSQFKVSNIDDIKYIATFAFCLAPGHIVKSCNNQTLGRISINNWCPNSL